VRMNIRRGLLLTALAVMFGSWGVLADTLLGNTPQRPLEPTAYSNGCGGDTGIGAVSDVVSWFFDTQSYVDSHLNPLAPTPKANFRPACDLHDAGYSGGVVFDRINGGVVDFRNWSRKQVDDKFLADLKTICTREIPVRDYALTEAGTKGVARNKCLNRGGPASFGALSYYDAVRRLGGSFFDADPATPGLQRVGSRPNN
jgi:hypothetical protein